MPYSLAVKNLSYDKVGFCISRKYDSWEQDAVQFIVIIIHLSYHLRKRMDDRDGPEKLFQ